MNPLHFDPPAPTRTPYSPPSKGGGGFRVFVVVVLLAMLAVQVRACYLLDRIQQNTRRI